MWIKVLEDGLCNDYATKSRGIGSFLLTVGFILSIYILFSPLSMPSILGIGLLFTGLFTGYFTAKMNPHVIASWSKTLLIFLTGLFFLFVKVEPIHVSTILGLFFTAGMVNNFYLAYLTRQNTTAVAWSIHAVLSAYFAIDTLFYADQLSLDSIALFVAINLMADGLVVIYSGRKIFIRP